MSSEYLTMTILSSPLLFKEKLGIGDAAYKWLTLAEHTKDVVIGGGGGAFSGLTVSGLPVVATIIVGSPGWWTFGFATAVTPMPWVVGITVGVGIAGYSSLRMWKKFHGKFVTTIPRHTNTGLNYLADSIFSLIAPIYLKMCHLDNDYSKEIRIHLKEHFVKKWGYDEEYFDKMIDNFINGKIYQKSIRTLMSSFTIFVKDSKDCNVKVISENLNNCLIELSKLVVKNSKSSDQFINEVENYLK